MKLRQTRGRVLRLVVALAAAGAVAGGAYAYTASNTMPGTSSAGTGSVTISGYTVSGVTYTLNGTDPTKIDQVTFTISPASTGTVKVKLESAGSWYSCANSGGSVTCATTSPQATVLAANQLTVVAAD